MRLLFPILLMALAGCTDEATYSLSGAFTQDRTDGDIDELSSLAQQHGGQIVIMESFPEQFRVTDLSQADCSALHGQLVQKEYLGSVGACTLEADGADPY